MKLVISSRLQKANPIIGKTSGGHEVHKDHWAAHGKHAGWSRDDHKEAAKLHLKRAKKTSLSLHYFSHPDRKKKYHKLVNILNNAVEKHKWFAAGHEKMAQGGK